MALLLFQRRLASSGPVAQFLLFFDVPDDREICIITKVLFAKKWLRTPLIPVQVTEAEGSL